MDRGPTVPVPLAVVFESLAQQADLLCQLGPANWNNSVQRSSQSKTMSHFTNIDVHPHPFTKSQKGITWTTSQVLYITPYAVQLWKCNNDDRLMALISYYPRFPVIIERITNITPTNVKEIVEQQLHEITLDGNTAL